MAPDRDERAAVITGPNGPRELSPGEAIRIGRHHENDVVLKDSRVSRFHATIRWDPELERPILYDNGSQNGTQIDGKTFRGSPSPLSHGSDIEVGGFRLTVALRNCGETPALLRSANDMVTLFSEQGPEVKGTIGVDASVRELLQRVEVERRSGTLRLGETARVTVCLGKVMTAQHESEEGVTALERVLRSPMGTPFRFVRDLEPTEDAMDLWFSDYLRARTDRYYTTRQWKRDELRRQLEESGEKDKG